jgi:ABC-type uncharacterized transport system involved in gliding motility auxiliary subunit
MGVKDISRNYIKFITYVIVVVLINVAGITLFFRLDLTANKVYSISEASRRVVSTLSEPLTINVFFTKNLPAPHNNTEQYLHDLLNEYALYANQHFNYRFYDVSSDEGDISPKAKSNQALAENYGIHPVQIQVIEKDEVKFQRGYMGLVLIHGDLIEHIPAITSTDGLEYELTTAIQKLNNKISALLRLPEKIQVQLYLSSSLKVVAPFMRLKNLSHIPDKIENIVEKLNTKNYGKLDFEYVDALSDDDIETTLKQYNILRLKWPSLSGDSIPPGQGIIGLVMKYGDKAVEIPLIHVLRIPLVGKHYELVNLDDLETIINEAVESLIDINEDIGYLASHGTPRLSQAPSPTPLQMQPQDALSAFKSLTSKNYTIKDVDLKEGNIPDGLGCMVLASPTEPFTDYELFQIDQFLMRGGNLALFLDAFKEVTPPTRQPFAMNQGLSYVPLNTGLERLLTHYGIGIKQSYVMDENCYKQAVPTQFGGGERAIYFAPIIKNRFIDKDLRFMKNIKGLVAMKISPLKPDTEQIKKNGLKAMQVFSSSEKSWEMKGRINLNPMMIRPPQSPDEQRSNPLAYILEGKFPSYFSGKPIPEKESEEKDTEQTGSDVESKEKKDTQKKDDETPRVDMSTIEGQGAFMSEGKPAKVFIMASSEMLRDNILDEKGRTPNAMFIMNVLDFLNNREDTAIMRSKQQRFNPLVDTQGTTKTLVKSFNIAGLPVLVVLFGLLVWFRRHARKKRIQMMFQS